MTEFYTFLAAFGLTYVCMFILDRHGTTTTMFAAIMVCIAVGLAAVGIVGLST